MKKCTKCLETKPVEFFGKLSISPDGLRYKCRECRKICATEKYRTLEGRIIKAYKHMSNRVRGKGSSPKLYEGLEICTKDEFTKWALQDRNYKVLLESWEKQGYPLTLTPTVDRIDSKRGYSLGNIQWLSYSDNASKTDRSCSRAFRKFSDEEIRQIRNKYVTEETSYFYLAKEYKVNPKTIYNIIKYETYKEVA